MSVTHKIVVCTEDAVLAKKVRFLLARDDCLVDIVDSTDELRNALTSRGANLVILSRALYGEDGIEEAQRLATTLDMPTTLVLGGEETSPPPGIHVLPDPIDTQAIYRLASETLDAIQVAPRDDTTPFAMQSVETRESPVATMDPYADAGFGEKDLGGIMAAAALDDAAEEAVVPEEIELDTEAVGGATIDPITDGLPVLSHVSAELEAALDAAADRTDAEPESEPTFENIEPEAPEHNDITFEAEPMNESPSSSGNNLGLSGPLNAARFSKVLYQCWTMEAQGALVLTTDDEELTIFFDRGAPVHIESNIPGDRIGITLVSKGRMTDSQYGTAAKHAIEMGVSLGLSIVEKAFLSADALGREQGEAARERIVRLFATENGTIDFAPDCPMPKPDHPFRIPVGRILVEGLKNHTSEAMLTEIIEDPSAQYFRLNSPIEDLSRRFPLSERETAFLAFSGRAYNVSDACGIAGMDARSAHMLMALLTTCEEVEDFTPGVREFEARLQEERSRQKEEPPAPAKAPEPEPPAAATPDPEPATELAPDTPPQASEPEEVSPVEFSTAAAEPAKEASQVPAAEPPPLEKAPEPPSLEKAPEPPPLEKAPEPPPIPTTSSAAAEPAQADETKVQVTPPAPLRSTPSTPAAASPPTPPQPPPPPPATTKPTPAQSAANTPPIPAMPVPPGGVTGKVPRQVVFSPPLPRGPDGQPQETPERTRSREHFQRGVTLLGQGTFEDAEEAFRDAIALCSEEHVYLIGLARALYYNPIYGASSKVPVLRSIVDRASYLAPGDARVETLNDWVKNAESQLAG